MESQTPTELGKTTKKAKSKKEDFFFNFFKRPSKEKVSKKCEKNRDYFEKELSAREIEYIGYQYNWNRMGKHRRRKVEGVEGGDAKV